MAEKVLIDKSNLTEMADKLREVNGTSSEITFNEFKNQFIDLCQENNEDSSDDTDNIIKLTTDITESMYMVNAGEVLDLNGHKITSNYFISFGNVIDSSPNKSGCISANANSVTLQHDNEQFPIIMADGIHFIKIENFNYYLTEDGKYCFQPKFESSAINLLLNNENSGTEIIACFYPDNNDSATSEYSFSQYLNYLLESYDVNTNNYNNILTLELTNIKNYSTVSFFTKVRQNFNMGAVTFKSPTITYTIQ